MSSSTLMLVVIFIVVPIDVTEVGSVANVGGYLHGSSRPVEW